MAANGRGTERVESQASGIFETSETVVLRSHRDMQAGGGARAGRAEALRRVSAAWGEEHSGRGSEARPASSLQA